MSSMLVYYSWMLLKFIFNRYSIRLMSDFIAEGSCRSCFLFLLCKNRYLLIRNAEVYYVSTVGSTQSVA